LPAQTATKYISLGHEREDVGKVCRLYNNSPFGGASYYVYVSAFGIKENFTDATIGGDATNYYVIIPPQCVAEFTCFEMPKTYNGVTYDVVARWDVTGRFGYQQFMQASSIGRHPMMIAMGTLTGSSSGASLSGYWYNGKYISDMLSVTRTGTGYYTIKMKSGSLPSGYMVFTTGIGTTQMKGTVQRNSTTEFVIYTADDSSRNDGSCYFMIMDPNWWYKLY
jgi:hypothetical protein